MDKSEKLFIGLMSGTSMDAIDTAVVSFTDGKYDLIAYEEFSIDDSIRRAVRNLNKDSSIEDVTAMDGQLGHCFAEACLTILKDNNLTSNAIAAIGSHGQTILHLPDDELPRTLQIGDPNIIAYKTGITTVTDFRRMDMAAGGQGAPFAPGFHAEYFRSTDKNRIILNLGGIANITVLPADMNTAVTGFDTGPGNGLLDDWNQRHQGTEFDADGQWAQSGSCNEDLLNDLLNDGYFNLPPPKSTGRDYFNLVWLGHHLEKHKNLKPEDVQATLHSLSCSTIQRAIEQYALQVDELYACGGGAQNSHLMKTLDQALAEIKVDTTEVLGLNPNAVEAVTFAWLAKRRLDTLPGNLSSVTGANRQTSMGGVYIISGD